MASITSSLKAGFLSFIIMFLVSCSSADPNIISKTDILHLHLGGEPTYLNPVLSTDSPSSSVEGLVFSGLFRINSDMELEPDLVESYDVNEEGIHYTFRLKRDVTWHDGIPFTAHDVKFTFDVILDPKTNTVRRSNFVLNGTAVQFNVIDDYTIEAILPQPFAPFLIRMAMGILPKHLLEGEDINKADFNRAPVGTGPYKFQSWQPAQYVQLERNDHYYMGKPKTKLIVMKIVPDANTALLALEKGEIDEAGIPAKDFSRYSTKPFLNVHRYYDLVYTYMGFNLKHPFFSDSKVRRAIAHAINKDSIVSGVLKGFGVKADIPASPVLWSYPDNEDIPKFAYNPSFAKELLKEAGFKVNPKTQLFEKDGKPFSFKIITNKGNKDREKVAQIIQRFLAEIGVEVHIQLMEWSSFIKVINAKKSPKDYDAVILGWSLGLDPDSYSIWHSSQYPEGFNFVGYLNPEVDVLLERGRTTTGKEQRKEIYKELYQHIAQDVPYLFLYFPESIIGINKRVEGLSRPGPAGLMNPIENVYLVD
ncbi:peptide-binding protein [Candidatus Marinamargulisbacteria bacterium SCGC AAA071-K20]|nr:peptide-binding protein [Candidatus Marinamargulisbacteria bacterium SCGC AAA071-K20]